jgi:putative ABC transport system permease protein
MPGTDEVIVAQRMSRRFANCAIGDKMRFGQRDFTVVGHFTAGRLGAPGVGRQRSADAGAQP